MKYEIGYVCGKGSNHVDLYGVDEAICGNHIGKVYIELDNSVSEAEADNIIAEFVAERRAHLEAWENLDDYV